MSDYHENNMEFTKWWFDEWTNGNRIKASVIKGVQERIMIRRDKAIEEEYRKREFWG